MLPKIHHFEIWLADLPLREGSHIQDGFRPVVIVSNDACNRYSPIVSVIPLTTKHKKPRLPTHVMLREHGLACASTVLCEQITQVDKSSLRRKIGRVCTAADREAISILAVKIIVSLGSPGARNTNPSNTQVLRQLTQLLIIQVDGRIDLHQVLTHGCQGSLGIGQQERLGSGDLTGGVSLPEGAAGDFGKFHIVAHEHGVLLVQGCQFAGVQFDKFSHSCGIGTRTGQIGNRYFFVCF